MSKQYTLRKGERLKKRTAIEQLFKEGTSLSVFPFRVYYFFNYEEVAASPALEEAKPSVLQFGVSVGKRHFKKAVHRNRIKRIIRESFRLQKGPLQTMLIQKGWSLKVFFIYTGKEMLNFELSKQKTGLLLQRLIEEANKR